MRKPADDLPLALTRQIDSLCDQFEQALQETPLPDMRAYLQRVESIAQTPLLAELVGIELEHWQRLNVKDPGQKIIAHNADLATQIKPILSDLETQDPSTEIPADTSLTNQPAQTTEGLYIRCPNCGNRLQLLVDAELTGIPCPACGSNFNLSGNSDGSGQAVTISHIGQFELIDRLGIGSFGTVWKARDTELDRIVAVKIPRRAESEEENEKFLREARSAAQLRHPNIVSVYEVGRDQDRIYIISDFIQGVPLSTVLEGGRLGQREAIALLVKVAEALEHAHQKGVIHRDIKPSNVILDDEGQPHLTDFGLAKRETGEATITLEGQVLGTPAYMSPEQAQGDAHQAGRQSDIYSLGVMLFQLLTGELPFRGSTQMLLHQAIHEPAPSPRRLDPNISRDLETITLKCLEKEPAHRYASAQALADDMNCYLQNEPIQARPLGPWQRSWRWCQRRGQQAGLRTAVMGLLVAFGVAAGSTLWVRNARHLVLESEEKAKQHAAGLASLEYTNQIQAAYSSWKEGWAVQSKRQLQLTPLILNRSSQSGLEWRLLESLIQSPQARVLAGHEGAVRELAVFPDQRRVASVGTDGLLKIWDTVTGKCLQTVDFVQQLPNIDLATGGLNSVAISPDGRYVAAGGHVVGVCDLQHEGQVRELLRVEHNVESLAFSRDGQQLAAGVRYHEVVVVTLEGEVVNRIPCGTRVNSLEYLANRQLWIVPHSKVIKAPSCIQLRNNDFSQVVRTYRCNKFLPAGINVGRISPDGCILAVGSHIRPLVVLLDIKTGRVAATTPDYREYLLDFCFAPDGQSLAISYANGSVRCLQLHQSEEGLIRLTPYAQTFQAHQGEIRCVRFVDSETLVTCGEDGLVKVSKPFQVHGRQALEPNLTVPWSTEFSPDGMQLLTYHPRLTTLSLYDTKTGNRMAHCPVLPFTQVIWSPTTKQVAARSDESSQVHIYNSKLQHALTIEAPHKVHGIGFSPDGNFLATIDQDEVILFRTANGRPIHRHPLPDTGRMVQFSHNGKWLAYGGSSHLLGLWNPSATGPTVELPSEHFTRCLAFSPDDQLLATGHQDGIVRLWQIEGAKLLTELVGHSKTVTRLFFSQDGHTLISTASDNTSRVWSVTQRCCLGVLDQKILAISDDNRHMVIAYPESDPVFPTTFIQSID